MKQFDYYLEAVQSWQQANRNLKNFARCCSLVSGEQTQALAEDCGCSIYTVNDYRNAYNLYTELSDRFELAQKVWEAAPIALWVKAAQLRTRLSLSLEKTWDYLQTASEEGMTREQMAAHVDNKENDTPQWIRRLKSVARLLTSSKNDWKTSLPLDLRTRYDKAEAVFASELNAIVESAKAVEAQAK